MLFHLEMQIKVQSQLQYANPCSHLTTIIFISSCIFFHIRYIGLTNKGTLCTLIVLLKLVPFNWFIYLRLRLLYYQLRHPMSTQWVHIPLMLAKLPPQPNGVLMDSANLLHLSRQMMYMYVCMFIVAGNGHGNTSSNPERGWLHFT